MDALRMPLQSEQKTAVWLCQSDGLNNAVFRPSQGTEPRSDGVDGLVVRGIATQLGDAENRGKRGVGSYADWVDIFGRRMQAAVFASIRQVFGKVAIKRAPCRDVMIWQPRQMPSNGWQEWPRQFADQRELQFSRRGGRLVISGWWSRPWRRRQCPLPPMMIKPSKRWRQAVTSDRSVRGGMTTGRPPAAANRVSVRSGQLAAVFHYTKLGQ